MPLAEKTKIWLKGLVNAAANGAGVAGALYVTDPHTPIETLVRAGAIGAAFGVINYFKASPLP